MAKKLVIATPTQLANVGISPELCELYDWAIASTASVDEAHQKDFVSDRNEKTEQIKELWKKIALLEQAAESIKATVKALYKVGPETDLPKGISWNAETYTAKFTDALVAVQKMMLATNTSWEKFMAYVSPANAREACGVTDEKMSEIVGDLLVKTPKDRALSVK